MQFITLTTFAAISLLASYSAFASRVFTTTVVCPIGGKSFQTIEAASGTQVGQHLDLKPYGMIVSPWPIAKCPDNGFVIYKNDFTKAELQLLNAYVLGSEYQSLQKTESNYYLAALLMRHQKAPKPKIAYTLLQSTWEVESDSRYKKYATETLSAFEAILEKPPSDLNTQTIMQYQQLAGEIERRLGRFGAAKVRFNKLLANKAIRKTPLESIVLQEIKLVSQKSSKTHRINVSNTK